MVTRIVGWVGVHSIVQSAILGARGGWESEAYMVYIWNPRETLCAVAQSLVQQRARAPSASPAETGAQAVQPLAP